jgi:hypothetical protein
MGMSGPTAIPITQKVHAMKGKSTATYESVKKPVSGKSGCGCGK